jgi:hypothetical protein
VKGKSRNKIIVEKGFLPRSDHSRRKRVWVPLTNVTRNLHILRLKDIKAEGLKDYGCELSVVSHYQWCGTDLRTVDVPLIVPHSVSIIRDEELVTAMSRKKSVL